MYALPVKDEKLKLTVILNNSKCSTTTQKEIRRTKERKRPFHKTYPHIQYTSQPDASKKQYPYLGNNLEVKCF